MFYQTQIEGETILWSRLNIVRSNMRAIQKHLEIIGNEFHEFQNEGNANCISKKSLLKQKYLPKGNYPFQSLT